MGRSGRFRKALKATHNVEAVYPHVKSLYYPEVLGAGPWPSGKPQGVTIHYTADRNLERVRQHGVRSKIGYHLLIDRDGYIHQTCFLDRRVNHAGSATWRGKSPNRHHIAVSLLSWGTIEKEETKFKSWSGVEVPMDDIVEIRGAYWDTFTDKQENSLLNILFYFIAMGIDPKDVCGHDECCLPPGRKVDPGGCLSTGMAKLRAILGGGNRKVKVV